MMKHFWWWNLLTESTKRLGAPVIVAYTGWKHYEGTEEVYIDLGSLDLAAVKDKNWSQCILQGKAWEGINTRVWSALPHFQTFD